MANRRFHRLLAVLTFGSSFPFASSASAQISGVVRDAVTLAPLPNAQVAVQATSIKTLTAADGTFSLPAASGTDLWVVAAPVYYYEKPLRVTTPATGVEFLVDAVPPGNNLNYSFITPSACGICHPDQFEQWTGSPMSLAGKNTWVYDLYNGTGTPGGMNGFVYTRDSVHRAANPNSECASCHQPESWIKQPHRALEPIGSQSQNAKRGVSCEVCHKVAHTDEAKINYPGIYPGAVTVTLPDNGSSNQVSYGAIGDVDFEEPYIMRASWQPEITSTMCGACHQDKNDPDDDGEFEEANGVISEPTFLEWREGPFGQEGSPLYTECVVCHMPPFGATYMTEGVMDPDPPERDPSTLRHHGLEAIDTMVDGAALLAMDVQQTQTSLNARVIVTNAGAGHRLPTGVTIRNMILYVRAWRIGDNLPLASTGTQVIDPLGGVGSPAQGYYAGQPGKLWAKVTADANGAHPVPFTEATSVFFDNRIAPLASDTTHYSFQLPPGGGTYALQARLLYRRAFRSLIDTKGWTKTGDGAPLADLAAPYFGQLMAKATWPNETVAAPDVRQEATTHDRFALTISPNPVAERATVDFSLPEATRVRLGIYDAQGRLHARLTDQQFSAGRHTVGWLPREANGDPLEAGVYWCRLEAGNSRAASTRLVVIH
ncbi:MAG: T9SS type A sorting domain-containing protein [Candidatus Eisenbacteria bacterium]